MEKKTIKSIIVEDVATNIIFLSFFLFSEIAQNIFFSSLIDVKAVIRTENKGKKRKE